MKISALTPAEPHAVQTWQAVPRGVIMGFPLWLEKKKPCRGVEPLYHAKITKGVVQLAQERMSLRVMKRTLLEADRLHKAGVVYFFAFPVYRRGIT